MVVTAGEEGGGVGLTSGGQRLRMFPRTGSEQDISGSTEGPRVSVVWALRGPAARQGCEWTLGKQPDLLEALGAVTLFSLTSAVCLHSFLREPRSLKCLLCSCVATL